MPIPKGLAAKARLIMDNGEKVYIEVRQGSTFCHFYTLYTVRGRTRKALIARNRNVAEKGIEELVEQLVQHFKKHTTRRVLETRIWLLPQAPVPQAAGCGSVRPGTCPGHKNSDLISTTFPSSACRQARSP